MRRAAALWPRPPPRCLRKLAECGIGITATAGVGPTPSPFFLFPVSALWREAGSGGPGPAVGGCVDGSLGGSAEWAGTGLARGRGGLFSSRLSGGEGYGTRCATLVALSRDGGAQFVERSFDASGATTGEVAFRFAIDHTASSITR